MQWLHRFLGDERGAVSIEYVLIATLISLAIIVGAGSIGNTLGDFFSNVSTNLE